MLKRMDDASNNPCRTNRDNKFYWWLIIAILIAAIAIMYHTIKKSTSSMESTCKNTMVFFSVQHSNVVYQKPTDQITEKKLKHVIDRQTMENLKKMEQNVGELKAEIDGKLLKRPHNDWEPEKYDFALKSNGAQIESIDGECSMTIKNFILNILGGTKGRYRPDQMIDTVLYSGFCYPFKKSPCSVTIKLAYKVHIKSIAIGHITPPEAPDGQITSAPKDFKFYGLNEPLEKNEVLINSYSYDIHLLKPFQYFDVVSPGKSFTHVKFEFLSNHGNENYTCVYRVCVFGIKA